MPLSQCAEAKQNERAKRALISESDLFKDWKTVTKREERKDKFVKKCPSGKNCSTNTAQDKVHLPKYSGEGD